MTLNEILTKYPEAVQIYNLRNKHDKPVAVKKVHGYNYIMTEGHGYLVVPRGDPNVGLAVSLCDYGYITNTFVFLEEDSEAPKFLEGIGVQNWRNFS